MKNSPLKYRNVQSVMRAYDAGLVADPLLREFAREVRRRDEAIAELTEALKPKPKPRKKKEDTDES